LESVARYHEIKVIVLNHLEPDHTGALPELLRRAPQARLYISFRAQAMLKALLKQEDEKLDFTPVDTGDSVSLGDRTLRFFNAPYLHWPDTQLTFLEEEQILFSGDAFGSYGWTGEAVPMIEDRLRGLKFRVPVKGLRIKLIPTERELQQCHDFGRELAEMMVGKQQKRVIDMADLLNQ